VKKTFSNYIIANLLESVTRKIRKIGRYLTKLQQKLGVVVSTIWLRVSYWNGTADVVWCRSTDLWRWGYQVCL